MLLILIRTAPTVSFSKFPCTLTVIFLMCRSPHLLAILRDIKQLQESLSVHPDSSIYVRQVCSNEL